MVHDIYEHTVPGGALVLVEKVLGNSNATDRLMTDLYYGLKRANGYGEEEIEREAAQPGGRPGPVAAAWNEDLLRRAGFDDVECFWRCLNFAGWVAVKRDRRPAGGDP